MINYKYIIISLFLVAGNTYAEVININNNKKIKVSTFSTFGTSKANLFRKRYIIEKTYEQRKIKAKKIAKAYRTCVNTLPKKDPNLIQK